MKILHPKELFGRFRQTKVLSSLTGKLQQSPDFGPQIVIRDWADGDAFTIGDALTGVIIFGTTGGGKTTGPGKHLAYGCLAKGFGALVLTAKPDECAQWVKYATETGRLADVRIIDASGKYQFNFMNHEATRPGAGAGFTTNIVRMLVVIAMAIAGDSSPEGGGNGGSNKFWQDALEHMLTNLVDLLVLARVEVSLSLMRSILNSAPMTVEQATNQEWLDTSDCASALRGAEKMTIDGDPEAFADYEECKTYWLKEFPALSEKTRSIIVLTFSMLVRPLVTRPLRKLFSAGTNITPEDAFDGKIIIIDTPVQEFSVAGRIANLIWKYAMQGAIMRRTPPREPGQYLRPVLIFSDEFQNFVTSRDSEYQAVARSAGGCSIYLTQNRESLRRVLKSDDAVDSLLANLQCMIFCANTGATNDWASKQLGERYVKINSTNVGQSRNEGAVPMQSQGNFNSGLSRSEQRRFFVEPATFTTLKRGGPQNDFKVEAIVYKSGHIFHNGDDALPYKKLTFNQR